MSFDPSRFRAGTTSHDPDADWTALAEKLPATSFRPSRSQEHYIPAIPYSFLRIAAQAGDALAVILVALAEMRMRGVSELALGPAIWEQTGNPGKRVRARLLRQIGQLPASLCQLVERKGRPHLLVTGPAWPQGRSTGRKS